MGAVQRQHCFLCRRNQNKTGVNKSTEKTRSFCTSDPSFLLPCFLSGHYFLCDVSMFVTFATRPHHHHRVAPSCHRALSHPLPAQSHPPRDHLMLTHSHFVLLSSHPSLPLSLTVSICLSLSHKYIFFFFFLGCRTPHTHFASLVSRTQATRTAMSSMRSWILQLWPPLPAHEAPLTLARGILSSMQPSSLAHTSACHYRPFPSDFGLKVHRPMNSFPRMTPPPPLLPPTWFPCVSSSSAILFPPLPSLC